MKLTTPVRNKRYKAMRHFIARGVPGVYRATSFKLKRAALPVLIAVFLAVFSYLSISNALASTGATSVDRVTIFYNKSQSVPADGLYRTYARKLELDLSYEEFCRLIDLRFVSTTQMESIMRKHGKNKNLYGGYKVILISEKNEFIEAYRVTEFEELLLELINRGYLEDVQ